VDPVEIRKLAACEDAHWWYRERRHLLADQIRRLRPGTAVDVGAAGGGNTRVLQGAGWTAIALEYGEQGAEVARDRGLVVIRADAHRLPVGDASLDLVVAFDVLEHLADDATAAAEIHRGLRPGGTALIAVPAGMDLWSAHDVDVGHVRRYDRAGLSAVLSDAGLCVEELWSWNVLLRPVVRVRRKKIRGSDLTELPRSLNVALGAVIAAERRLPVRRLPGVSLVARARRPA
jgi:SAM-dependent methyltransferase